VKDESLESKLLILPQEMGWPIPWDWSWWISVHLLLKYFSLNWSSLLQDPGFILLPGIFLGFPPLFNILFGYLMLNIEKQLGKNLPLRDT